MCGAESHDEKCRKYMEWNVCDLVYYLSFGLKDWGKPRRISQVEQIFETVHEHWPLRLILGTVMWVMRSVTARRMHVQYWFKYCNKGHKPRSSSGRVVFQFNVMSYVISSRPWVGITECHCMVLCFQCLYANPYCISLTRLCIILQNFASLCRVTVSSFILWNRGLNLVILS